MSENVICKPRVGKTITFHVRVKTIRDTTAEEINHSHAEDSIPEGMLH